MVNKMKDLTFLKDNLIAHRGYHNMKNKIPENSIPAFKKAIRYNYTIELDVHLTKDNKLVVFHDDNLKRVCGVNKIIEDCTYDELLKYNLFDTKYKIPLFEEVLRLVDGKVGLLIETKTGNFNGKLESKLSSLLDNYNGLFAIQSFNPISILWFKKKKNNYIRGLLSSDFKHDKKVNNLRKNLARSLFADIFLRTDFISYDINALPNNYVKNKRKSKLVLGWTIRSKKDYDKAKKYCDNLICENMNEYAKEGVL